jgi:hypothetical protein
MAVCTKYERDGLEGALAILWCLYCAIVGCFSFVNSGSAAYEPPPAKVIAYGPSAGLPPPPDVPVSKPIATADSIA